MEVFANEPESQMGRHGRTPQFSMLHAMVFERAISVRGSKMRLPSFLFPLIVILTTSTVAIGGYDAPMEIEGATTIDVSMARELHDRGVPFVDVRNPDGDEWTPGYDMGHIAGAVNLPLRGAFTEASLSEVASKDQEVVIYCEAIDCFLTSTACKKAIGWQFEKVYYFRDGYKAWKRAGHSIEM